MTASSSLHVAVIGAGVIGASVARALARRGAQVTLIEAQDQSREASWAAGGMLAPHSEFNEPTPLFALGRASLALYPALRDELREETGQDIDLRMTGTLHLILSDDDEQAAEAKGRFLAEQGIEHRRLSAAELRREEPALTPQARGALEIPDHAVDNRRLWQALITDCQRHKVALAFGERVLGFVSQGRRLLEVASESETFRADEFVVAAGAWSEQLADMMRFDLPMTPIKGQLIKYGVDPEMLRRVVRRGHSYLVPRSGGELIAGATSETAGFEKTLTEEALAQLQRDAAALVPTLAERPVIERWAGLRPRLADGLPAFGRVPGHENLTVATGHYRNGILLTPITGEVIAAVVLGELPPVDLTPFDPARFTRS
jgi:glycine oxidase